MPDYFVQGDTFDPARVAWIFDHDQLVDVLVPAIDRASEIVIDLETTGLNEHETGDRPEWPVRARISLASLTLPNEDHPDDEPITYVVPLSHPDGPMCGTWVRAMTTIAETIQDSRRPVTNQNLKFDMRWIYAHTGIDLSRQFAWDTQISSHLLDETKSTRLKERAPETFGIDRWDDHDLSTPGASEHVPLFELGLYAARDTYWTWRLARLHRFLMGVGDEGQYADEPETAEDRELFSLGQLAVWCAMPQSATLTAMEIRGIQVDLSWISDKVDQLTGIVNGEWNFLTGRYQVDSKSDPSLAPTSLWFRSWADRAVEAGDLRVGGLTASGKPQWTKSILTRQARAGSEVAESLLRYRAADKRHSYLKSWLKLATPERRIHPTYHAGRVVTGRLSCSDPNMQQVTKELKPAFVPGPGRYIAELDYSQIELRVAAFLSRCEPMIEAFRRGDDLHRLLAARITGKDPADITAAERQAGKSANFGLLYLMGPEGFREYAADVYDVHFTSEEAELVHNAFFEQWTGMSEWHAKMTKIGQRHGQVVSPLGRVRRLPNIHSSNGERRGHDERNAVNSPVQGFASDLMQMAAASIQGYLPGHDPLDGVRLVGTVHDSIVVEVPADDWKRSTARCLRRMLGIGGPLRRLGCDLDVPLAAEATVGTRWGMADIGVIS